MISYRIIRRNCRVSDLAANRGRPNAISPRIHPTLHISADVQYGDERRISGARYHIVTT